MMRSAAVLTLVFLLGIAIYIRFGRHPKSADAQPQTSPPPISQPLSPPISQPLSPPISQPLSPFEDDYEKAKGEKDRTVVLVFTSKWCPHCVKLKDHLESSNIEGLLFCFIDTKEKPDLTKQYKVKRLPTSVMLKDGLESSRKIGFVDKDYEKWLSQKTMR